MAEGWKTIKLSDIRITDSLFGSYSRLVAEKMIPYQWRILNNQVEGAVPTYCIDNFRIAAGEMSGERRGVIFQDTDLYKWIEAVAFCIENGSGAAWEQTVDEVIELVGRAQREDGYLNTYFTVTAIDKRWSNLVEGHELYCAGHMIEAAVAYYKATGKSAFLEIAKKNADLICKVFGREDNQIHGYPGHQVIELALVKLYRVTGIHSYLNGAKYFLEERGTNPNYFLEEIKRHGEAEYFEEFNDYELKYSQSHQPPIEQRSAEGHAVRLMYMCSAMADIALECKDDKMMEACQAIWDSVTKRRMYITGGIGSSGFLERFTTDYDLPNTTNYAETCASIGLMMFGQRMAAATKKANYYDTVERALYNTVLAGIGMTGDRYFYVNPLEVVPSFCISHTDKQHIKPVRQPWFSVACCPTNVARTLASLGQYIYARDEEDVYINQFISSSVEAVIDDTRVTINLDSTMMQDGKIKILVKSNGQSSFGLKVRIPEYAGQLVLLFDGQEIKAVLRNGYACFDREWNSENRIEIDFDVKPRLVAANSQVREDAGKVAVMKGPCVYCLEEVDNGDNLASLYVSSEVILKEGKPLAELFGAIPVIEYTGLRLDNTGMKEEELYGKALYKMTPVALTAIPYSLWNNRRAGEMLVWQKVKF
ncbi:MAG: beta-L-arabinofuranosidase domain-containing protein [Mobilitalea sp.]